MNKPVLILLVNHQKRDEIMVIDIGDLSGWVSGRDIG